MLAARPVEAKATVVSTHKAEVKARVARGSPSRVSTVDKWATGNRNAGMSDEGMELTRISKSMTSWSIAEESGW